MRLDFFNKILDKDLILLEEGRDGIFDPGDNKSWLLLRVIQVFDRELRKVFLDDLYILIGLCKLLLDGSFLELLRTVTGALLLDTLFFCYRLDPLFEEGLFNSIDGIVLKQCLILGFHVLLQLILSDIPFIPPFVVLKGLESGSPICLSTEK